MTVKLYIYFVLFCVHNKHAVADYLTADTNTVRFPDIYATVLHFSMPVFPKLFRSHTVMALKNTHRSAHPCSRKYSLDDGYPKL